MEFLALHDDLFTEGRSKSTKSDYSLYKARVCTPQWFDEVNTEEESDRVQLLKYSADHAFRRHNFDKALTLYQESINLLSQTNLTMFRDIQESICRCFVKLGRAKDALHPAEELVNSAQNYDQKTTSLSLLSTVLAGTGDLEAEKLALMKSIWLHPMNCDAWLRLSMVFKSILLNPNMKGGSVDNVQPAAISPSQIVRSCLMRTRILAEHVGNVSPFVKDRYQQIARDVNKEMQEMQCSEDLQQLIPALEADVVAERGVDTTINPEPELIKAIDQENFEESFYKRWFKDRQLDESFTGDQV